LGDFKGIFRIALIASLTLPPNARRSIWSLKIVLLLTQKQNLLKFDF